jgi:peroxiredoxin
MPTYHRFTFCALILSALLFLAASVNAQDEVRSYTHVGQRMPLISLVDTDGNTFNIASLKGKIVYINFWATWCGPCSFELPRIEKEIWQAHKSENFVMLGIAREESKEAIVPFREKLGFTFAIAPDADRKIYNMFGNEGIPRSYVVSADGIILFQSVGYNELVFNKMTKLISAELKKLKPTTASK